MAGPSPLNSACNCCAQPPTGVNSIEYVSIQQSCNASSCGFEPCTSTEAVYDEENNCVVPAQICSPNFEDLTPAEQCAGKRYLTVTTVDTSGGNNHGRTEVRQYTIDEEGNCDLETTCSGSKTITYDFECSGEGGKQASFSSKTSYQYNEDCTVTESLPECSGTSSNSNSSCSMTYFYDAAENGCVWEGTEVDEEGDTYEVFGYGSGCCESTIGLPSTTTLTITQDPEPNCTITVTYSGENEQGSCSPEQLPPYPAFTECTPEGEEPPEPPELEEGQGRGLLESTAYKFTNPNNPAIKSEKRIKYRIAHSPTGTCYFKMWVRKVILQYKWEDCDTGFAGNPPRTPAWDIDCDENPCTTRWSTDGDPTVEDVETYEWEGNGYPCFEDDTKLFSACENIIYSPEKEIIAGENQEVVIEAKWSLIKDYEPNWPDENGESRLAGFGGCQGCKPNGFPIANPANCPVCE
jgi:hypothetical protein